MPSNKEDQAQLRREECSRLMAPLQDVRELLASINDARRDPPDRLAYLLDHQYTRRGLAWSRLKNADATRVAALREVAQRLDCEIFLALADVHESWSCDEDGRYGYQREWVRGYDEEAEDDQAEDDDGMEAPALVELLGTDIETPPLDRAGRRG